MCTCDCDDYEGAEIEERVAFEPWPLKLQYLRVSGICGVVRAFSPREKSSLPPGRGTANQVNNPLLRLIRHRFQSYIVPETHRFGLS